MARKQPGLTQPPLALAAEVGVRSLVDLEAGKPTLRRERVLGVMDARAARDPVERLAGRCKRRRLSRPVRRAVDARL